MKSAALGAAGLATARAAAAGTSSEERLPVAGAFDLVVAGGSATGVCAAVTAARAGLSVALVEYNAFFGGTATAGFVPVWHSLYSTDGKTQIIGGLTDEIENRLLARGEARLMENRANPSVGCYLNVAALQIALDEIVTECPKIRPFLKCHVVGAIKDRPGHLTAVIVEDKSGRRLLKAKAFIDATGDADLAARAGFETWSLPKERLQAHTLCALVSGTDWLREKYGSKFNLNAVMRPDAGADLKHVFGWTAPVIGSSNITFVAATRISDCNPSVANDLTAALLEGRRQLKRIVDTVNRKFPLEGGRRMALVAVASDLGIRESRHIRAKYRITAEDVLNGRHFAGEIVGKGSYRCDIHEGRGIVFRYLDGREQRMVATKKGDISWSQGRWRPETPTSPTYYEIPLDALLPVGSENLFCAGRMIDCERNAYGALRVMVNCNQMGEGVARHVARLIAEKKS